MALLEDGKAVLELCLVCTLLLGAFGHCVLSGRRAWRSRKKLRVRKKVREDAQARLVERLKQAEVEKSISTRIVSVSEVSGIMWVVYSLIMCLVYVTNYPRWFTNYQDLMMSISMFSFLAIRLLSGRMNKLVINILFSVVMLSITGVSFFADRGSDLAVQRSITIATLLRVLYSLTFCQVAASFIWNAFFSLAQLYIFMNMTEPSDRGSIMNYAVVEIIMTGVICAMTWRTHVDIRRETSHIVKLKSLSLQSTAMTTLLGLVCDVVVELDSSLCIVDDAARLSAMLGVNKQMCGMSLTSFMPEASDRESFESQLSGFVSSCAATQSNCRTGALHSTLRDSLANQIYIDIFFVVVPSLDGSTKCFIGIREIMEQPIAELPSSAASRRKSRRHRNASSTSTAGTIGAAAADGPGDALEIPASSEREAGEDGAEGELVSSGSEESESRTAAAPACPGGRARRSQSPQALEDNSASSIGSVGTSASRARLRLQDATFAQTIARGKKHSLIDAMLQWNIPVSRRACCPFHAVVSELKEQARSLSKMQCKPEFNPVGEGQCSGCGLIHELDSEKTTSTCCGEALTLSTSSASSLRRKREQRRQRYETADIVALRGEAAGRLSPRGRGDDVVDSRTDAALGMSPPGISATGDADMNNLNSTGSAVMNGKCSQNSQFSVAL